MRIHRACNNARIEEQRSTPSHAKRARSEEPLSLVLCDSPSRPSQRVRIEADEQCPSAAADIAADAAGALFVLHTAAQYVDSMQHAGVCWAMLLRKRN